VRALPFGALDRIAMLALAVHYHARHDQKVGGCVRDAGAVEPFPAGVHRVGHVAQGRAVDQETGRPSPVNRWITKLN
jgi:hypothetical protein